jgi:PhzF family phenazine biosynthesis protein
MRIPLFHVDAFTSRLFSGNPAAVCLPEKRLDDEQMQSIAAENNLSETAFLDFEKEKPLIRWFTPVTEVALCGHATLAAAFILIAQLKWFENTIAFQTRTSGTLTVRRRNGLFEMDFPGSRCSSFQSPSELEDGLGLRPKNVFSAGEDIMAVFDSEQQIRDLEPDMSLLASVECRGVIATAR